MKFFNKVLMLFALCVGIISCAEKGEPVQKTYSILFTENPVMVGSVGGAVSSAFVSEHQWTAEAVDAWISGVSVADGEVSFTVEANPDEVSRDGIIRFTVSGDSFTKDLIVRQTANTGGLKADNTSITLTTLGNATSVKVTSSENWDVTSVSVDWIEAVRKNSTTLELKADPNYTGSVRTGEVKVETASKKQSLTFSVKQEADNASFAGASSLMGRKFVHKSSGLVSKVLLEKFYNPEDNVNALEMQFHGVDGSAVQPFSIFLFEVDLTGDVTILTTCVNDDPASIKTTDAEVTAVAPIRDQLHAMQAKRPHLDVLCGVNGDFCWGTASTTSTHTNNFLHGIMYKDGVCLKNTFDGGSPCTVFAMMKDGTARIMTQAEYASDKAGIAEALGGRQILMEAGQPINFTDTRLEPRTAVGVSRDGKKVYLLVVDGRRSSYSVGASYDFLVKVFRCFDVYEAINLDGGGSSTFLVKNASASKGFETRNRPTDGTGDRAVPNGLAVVRGS